MFSNLQSHSLRVYRLLYLDPLQTLHNSGLNGDNYDKLLLILHGVRVQDMDNKLGTFYFSARFIRKSQTINGGKTQRKHLKGHFLSQSKHLRVK